MQQSIEKKTRNEVGSIRCHCQVCWHKYALALLSAARLGRIVFPLSIFGVAAGPNMHAGSATLSRNLTSSPARHEILSRVRRPSRSQANAHSTEARLTLSKICVLPDRPLTAASADAPRAQASNHNKRILVTPRLGDNRASSSTAQSRSSNDLVSHDLKNVCARLTVVCMPKTNCCGTSASSKI